LRKFIFKNKKNRGATRKNWRKFSAKKKYLKIKIAKIFLKMEKILQKIIKKIRGKIEK